MSKKVFTRKEAIKILSDMNQEAIEEYDAMPEDFDSMDNEELEAELCLSGYIHDEDMGGVEG